MNIDQLRDKWLDTLSNEELIAGLSFITTPEQQKQNELKFMDFCLAQAQGEEEFFAITEYFIKA